jgi:hypothetical protein
VRLEHIKILGNTPILLRAMLIIMIIAIIAAFVEIVFDPNPIQQNEKTHYSSGYYDGFDVM